MYIMNYSNIFGIMCFTVVQLFLVNEVHVLSILMIEILNSLMIKLMCTILANTFACLFNIHRMYKGVRQLNLYICYIKFRIFR